MVRTIVLGGGWFAKLSLVVTVAPGILVDAAWSGIGSWAKGLWRDAARQSVAWGMVRTIKGGAGGRWRRERQKSSRKLLRVGGTFWVVPRSDGKHALQR